MAKLEGMRIGCAMTGSFCTFEEAFGVWRTLKAAGAQLFPIMSDHAYSLDTRFYKARDARAIFEEICGREIWHTIPDVEPIGPRRLLDLMVIAPCTGNTLAKLALGIADTAATLAAKSHMRNGGPVLLAIATNDGLARNAKNIGALMAMRNIYFVPFWQDSPEGKPASVVARLDQLPAAAEHALSHAQIQPFLLQL
jgi:dipicolinate synthase subunit B